MYMKISLYWKIIYAICCLVYMGWMIHVGGNEFNRINGQHRRLAEQLDTGRIRTAALEELAAECSRDSRSQTDLEKDACSAWEPAVVEAKAKAITKRNLQAKQRGTVKLILFYTGFVVMFLIGPPILLYLLIIAIIQLKKNIKIVR